MLQQMTQAQSIYPEYLAKIDLARRSVNRQAKRPLTDQPSTRFVRAFRCSDCAIIEHQGHFVSSLESYFPFVLPYYIAVHQPPSCPNFSTAFQLHIHPNKHNIFASIPSTGLPSTSQSLIEKMLDTKYSSTSGRSDDPTRPLSHADAVCHWAQLEKQAAQAVQTVEKLFRCYSHLGPESSVQPKSQATLDKILRQIRIFHSHAEGRHRTFARIRTPVYNRLPVEDKATQEVIQDYSNDPDTNPFANVQLHVCTLKTIIEGDVERCEARENWLGESLKPEYEYILLIGRAAAQISLEAGLACSHQPWEELAAKARAFEESWSTDCN